MRTIALLFRQKSTGGADPILVEVVLTMAVITETYFFCDDI
jgi:hypothetical protein